MRMVATLCEVLAFLAGLAGLFQVLTAMTAIGASAVQQAAGVTFGIAIAVIPYCIAGIFHRSALRGILARRDA